MAVVAPAMRCCSPRHRLAAVPKSWRKALGFLRDAKEPRLPFGGNDLLARGIKDGKAVGETLKLLEARWIEAGFPGDAQSLAALLNQAIAETHDRS